MKPNNNYFYFIGLEVTLKLEHLPFLLYSLKCVASKWNQIGVYLNISHDHLENIRANPTLLINAPVSFLQEVLAYWLKQNTSSPNGEILLKAIEKAGDTKLAFDLRGIFDKGDHEKG